jgi:hypothetical protein
VGQNNSESRAPTLAWISLTETALATLAGYVNWVFAGQLRTLDWTTLDLSVLRINDKVKNRAATARKSKRKNDQGIDCHFFLSEIG